MTLRDSLTALETRYRAAVVRTRARAEDVRKLPGNDTLVYLFEAEADSLSNVADDLAALLHETPAEPHRCVKCDRRWEGGPVISELCGDCHRAVLAPTAHETPTDDAPADEIIISATYPSVRRRQTSHAPAAPCLSDTETIDRITDAWITERQHVYQVLREAIARLNAFRPTLPREEGS